MSTLCFASIVDIITLSWNEARALVTEISIIETGPGDILNNRGFPDVVLTYQDGIAIVNVKFESWAQRTKWLVSLTGQNALMDNHRGIVGQGRGVVTTQEQAPTQFPYSFSLESFREDGGFVQSFDLTFAAARVVTGSPRMVDENLPHDPAFFS